MVTIKRIAELAGVSRGTVDRVLNKRGAVKPETREKVQQIADDLKYQPNKAGLALAAQKKRYKLGVILFNEENPFFEEVIKGINKKTEELDSMGVVTITRQIPYNMEKELQEIDDLVYNGVSGIVLMPYNHEKIRKKINELVDSDIVVLTVNTDIEGSKRMAYVGSDYFKGGCTAAGLFARFTKGEVKLGIITGSSEILCHIERIRGLRYTLEKYYPQIQIVDIQENQDNQYTSYLSTTKMLQEHPEIGALFYTAGGVYGGCRAVEESGRELVIITFDEVYSTLELLNNGIISATIGQQPFWQGAYSLELLSDYLIEGKTPKKERNYSELIIRIRESI